MDFIDTESSRDHGLQDGPSADNSDSTDLHTSRENGSIEKVNRGRPQSQSEKVLSPSKQVALHPRIYCLLVLTVILLIIAIVIGVCNLVLLLKPSSSKTMVIANKFNTRTTLSRALSSAVWSKKLPTAKPMTQRSTITMQTTRGFPLSPVPGPPYCATTYYLNEERTTTTNIVLRASTEVFFLLDPSGYKNGRDVSGHFVITTEHPELVILWVSLGYHVSSISCGSSVSVRGGQHNGKNMSLFHRCGDVAAETLISSRFDVDYEFAKDLNKSTFILYQAIVATAPVGSPLNQESTPNVIQDLPCPVDRHPLLSKRCRLSSGVFCINQNMDCYDDHDCKVNGDLIQCDLKLSAVKLNPNLCSQNSKVIHLVRKNLITYDLKTNNSGETVYLHPQCEVILNLKAVEKTQQITKTRYLFRSSDSRIKLSFKPEVFQVKTECPASCDGKIAAVFSKLCHNAVLVQSGDVLDNPIRTLNDPMSSNSNLFCGQLESASLQNREVIDPQISLNSQYSQTSKQTSVVLKVRSTCAKDCIEKAIAEKDCFGNH